MKALIFDTETTGQSEPEIIESALMPLDGFPLIAGEIKQERFHPENIITLGALATHHIMDEDLIGCLPSSTFELPACDCLIGHNVDYDWSAAGKPDVKRICTLALARQIWTKADCHTLSAMLYMIDRKNARETLKNAHSAAADVTICLQLLLVICGSLQSTRSHRDAIWET